MLAAFLSLALTATTPPETTYGDIYLAETAGYELPFFNLKAGYAADISNSFLDMHSFFIGAQMRVWKYLSAGLLGHLITSDYSTPGKQLRNLEEVDIDAQITRPKWGIFSHSSLQLMLGQWNVMNLFPLKVDLLIGGGVGFIAKELTHGPKTYEASYLWTVEQELQFIRTEAVAGGLFVSVFGHTGGVFIGTGLQFGFN